MDYLLTLQSVIEWTKDELSIEIDVFRKFYQTSFCRMTGNILKINKLTELRVKKNR